jgi:hypothetical protein
MQVGGVVDGQGTDAVIDQHGDFRAAQDHRLGATRGQALDGSDIGAAGLFAHDATAELFEDDAMKIGAIDFRDDRGQPACREAIAVKALFHGEVRAQETDIPEAVGQEGIAGGVSDVNEWDINGGCDLVGNDVHGVGGQADEVGTRVLQAPGDTGQLLARDVPFAARLQIGYGSEIHRVDNKRGGVEATQPSRRLLVKDAVVMRRGLPAHAADQADGLHAEVNRWGMSAKAATTLS